MLSHVKVNVRCQSKKKFDPTKFVAILESDVEMDSQAGLDRYTSTNLIVHYNNSSEPAVFIKEEGWDKVEVYETSKGKRSVVNRSKVQFMNEFGRGYVRVNNKSKRFISLEVRKLINSGWSDTVYEYFSTFRPVTILYQDIDNILHVSVDETSEWREVMKTIEIQENFYNRSKTLKQENETFVSSEVEWPNLSYDNSGDILPTSEELRLSVESFRNVYDRDSSSTCLSNASRDEFEENYSATSMKSRKFTEKVDNSEEIKSPFLKNLNCDENLVITELKKLKDKSGMNYQLGVLLGLFLSFHSLLPHSVLFIILDLFCFIVNKIIVDEIDSYESFQCVFEIIKGNNVKVLKQHCSNQLNALMDYFRIGKSRMRNRHLWKKVADIIDQEGNINGNVPKSLESRNLLKIEL